MTTQYGTTKHEAEEEKLTKAEVEEKEDATHAEKTRAKAVAKEERLAKEKEELRLKEPVKAKLVRLLGELRTGSGSVRKAALEELETAVGGLKTEELVGDSDVEKAAKKDREEREKAEEKAEKERRAAELKEEKKEEKAGKY